jgi:hypothetical protein
LSGHSATALFKKRFVWVALFVLAAGSWLALHDSGGSGAPDSVAVESPGDSVSQAQGVTAPASPSIPTQNPSSGYPETPSRTVPGIAAQGAADTNQAGGATRTSTLLAATPDDTAKDNAGDEPEKTRMPEHWRICYPSANPANGGYLFTSDDSTAWSGTFSARISSRVAQPNPAGAAFCQTLSAARLKGQRVEYSIHLRTRDAVPGAHIVFRAERADGRVVAFYNMAERWVRGTTDWNRFSVVIDVPENAAVIFVGATLVGTGTLWMDDAGLTTSPGTPLTQQPLPANFYNQVVDASTLASELRNAGFEDTRERNSDGR